MRLSLRDRLRNFVYGVQNIVKWWRVIWQDRDWDYHHIFVILEFKLKQMEQQFLYNNMVMHHRKHLRALRTCIVLLNRMNCHLYYDYDLAVSEFRSYKHEEWPDLFSRFTKLPDTNFYRLEPMKGEQKRLYDKYSKHQDYLEKQDIDMFFKLFYKYHKYWWD